MAHVGGKVRGADEDPVDALGRGDGVERRETGAGFHLHPQPDLCIRGRDIVGDARKIRGPRQPRPIVPSPGELERHAAFMARFKENPWAATGAAPSTSPGTP